MTAAASETPAAETPAAPTPAPAAPTKTDDSLIPAKPAPAAAPQGLPEKDGYKWPAWAAEDYRREKISEKESRELLDDKGQPQWDKVAEKAVARHKEAQTALSERQKYLGAPKDDKGEPTAYELKVPEGIDPASVEVEAFRESSLWKGFEAKAREMNLNQAAVDEITAAYLIDAARENHGQREREMTRLRFAGWSNERLTRLGEFYAAKLPPEAFEAWRGMARDADSVLLFDALMNTMLATTTLPKESGPVAQTDPMDPYRERLKDPRNRQDPAFFEGTNAMLRDILAKHPEIASRYGR